MAFFSPAFLDELRNRVRISAVVGRKVKLKHKAADEYLGLCPFHQEKTPSFTVSDGKGFYHCFGCGVHGDVLRFITETERLTFVEAVKLLAEEAGVALPETSREAEEQYQKSLTLYDVMEAAAQWCTEQLYSAVGKGALDYCRQRGLTPEVITEFRLGYAPEDRAAMQQYLQGKGYTQAQMLETGLLTQNERGEVYARFRNRLMFPIQDAKGRVVAFGGRILGDGQPKYLNSPATSLFYKGEMLYNWHRARNAAAQKNAVAVVEGYMDTIALAAAGIVNVVAPLGTALTEAQVQHLWQVVKEPTLCLDGDAAGARAMAKAAVAHLAQLKPGYGLKFARLPVGEDPDDVLKKHGLTALRQMLGKAIPLSEALWHVELNRHKVTTPEEKAALEQRLQQHCLAIEDLTVRRSFEQYFRGLLWNIRLTNKVSRDVQSSSFARQAVLLKEDSEINRLEKILLYIVLHHPQLLQRADMGVVLHELELTDVRLQGLLEAALQLLELTPTLAPEALESALKQTGHEDVLRTLPEAHQVDKSLHAGAAEPLLLAGWQYFSLAWRSALVEAEFQQKLETMPEEQLWDLKGEKDSTKKLAEQAKIEYTGLLDAEMGV